MIGLRHGDYQRYRGYCTRRVKRLRKTLNLPQGDKRHFKKRDVNVTHLEAKTTNEKYVHIPLILSERAWAYAMQVKLISLYPLNLFVTRLNFPFLTSYDKRQTVSQEKNFI